MAEEIAYKVIVDSEGSGKSLKELKDDLKNARKELSGLTEGSKEYVAQLKKIGEASDNIDDLNDAMKSFTGAGKIQAFGNAIGGLASGFQAAQGAAALFGKEGEDLQKVLLKVQAASAFAEGIKGLEGLKDAFSILGQVIKANPIMLIAGIVIGIGTALFALKDKIKPVADAFDFLGDVIGSVVQSGKDFLDFLGLTDFAMEKTTQSIIDNTDRIKKANNDRYDSEIAAAKRAGKETEVQEIAKLNAMTKTNDVIISQLRARQQAQGELSDEDKKRLDELVSENRKAYQDILNLSDTYKDREVKNQEETTKRWIQESEKKKQAKLDEQAFFDAYMSEIDASNQEDKMVKAKEEAAAYNQWSENLNQQNVDFKESKDQQAADTIASNSAQQTDDQKRAAAMLATAKASNDSMMALSDLYFTVKRANTKKGSAEDLKAAKQQFKINKALAIQSAIISGIQGVVNALSAQSVVPEPFGTILKVATAVGVGIAAAANVAKIASTQFNEGGGGGTVSPTVPSSSSGGSGATAPTISTPQSGSTKLDSGGNIISPPKQQAPIVKAEVVETEITGTQKRVGSIETNAKI